MKRQVFTIVRKICAILASIGYPLLLLGKVLILGLRFFTTLPLSFAKAALRVRKALLFDTKKEVLKQASRPLEKQVAQTQLSDPFYYSWQEYDNLSSYLAFTFAFETAWFWRRLQQGWFEWLDNFSLPRFPRLGIQVPTWIVFILCLVVVVSPFVFGAQEEIFNDLPAAESLRDIQPQLSTKIFDRNGNLLYTIFKDQNRVLVPITRISPFVVHATIAIEDADFYNHNGISVRGIVRAFRNNLTNDTIQGGSTITQQLVKMTLLSPEKTWQRKVKEAILAIEVDWKFSKDEILTDYLNQTNYGGSVYGVEQASQAYFGKDAADLDLAESALLAGLPAAPSAYSPLGPSPEKAKERQREVLQRMVDQQHITQDQAAEAFDEPLSFHDSIDNIQAPHFVMYVRQVLADQFGEDMVSQGGLDVWTTLDLPTQASAEASVKTEINRIGKLNVSNGAAMVTNPHSGEILAMVGSKDYFDDSIDGKVNVTMRLRQPGSSIKPVTYVTAFQHGFSPSSTIEDAPVVFTSPGAAPWAPKNYDGRFHGTVTLRTALGSSYNIPAVRLLAQVGIPTVIDQGKKMGITTWDDPSRYGLALTLGGAEVTMYDMAKVYGTFANGGTTVDLNPLLQVQDHNGKVLYQNPCAQAVNPCGGKQTVSPLAAYQITSILTDNAARTPAFGPSSVLYVPNQEVAVKTGTTNNLRDNWTIGYTQDRVVLSWVGNNDNRQMSAVASGITGASPIWRSIMDTQIADKKNYFAMPTGLQRVKICKQTSTLPCAECPNVVEEVFAAGSAPTTACSAEMFANLPKPEDKKTAERYTENTPSGRTQLQN